MLSCHKRKVILICFLAIFFARNNSFAAYDIIKATTINNQTPEIQVSDDQEVPIYDDTTYDEIKREDDLLIKAGNKIKSLFNKKIKDNIEDEDTPQEEINEEIDLMTSKIENASTSSDKNTLVDGIIKK